MRFAATEPVAKTAWSRHNATRAAVAHKTHRRYNFAWCVSMLWSALHKGPVIAESESSKSDSECVSYHDRLFLLLEGFGRFGVQVKPLYVTCVLQIQSSLTHHRLCLLKSSKDCIKYTCQHWPIHAVHTTTFYGQHSIWLSKNEQGLSVRSLPDLSSGHHL